MRGERRSEVQRHGEGREMTTTQQGSRQGEWYGYVQPYRYYGPGYRGVGYYSVLYQVLIRIALTRARWTSRTRSSISGTCTTVRVRRRRGLGRWPPTGQFTGRGPKGYQRSDERIREDVSDRLMEHPDLDASEIEVKVSKGVVTLTGGVDSRWDKRLAEDIADAVSGVRDVMNQLSVSWQAAGGGRETASARGTAEASAPTASRTVVDRRPRPAARSTARSVDDRSADEHDRASARSHRRRTRRARAGTSEGPRHRARRGASTPDPPIGGLWRREHPRDDGHGGGSCPVPSRRHFEVDRRVAGVGLATRRGRRRRPGHGEALAGPALEAALVLVPALAREVAYGIVVDRPRIGDVQTAPAELCPGSGRGSPRAGSRHRAGPSSTARCTPSGWRARPRTSGLWASRGRRCSRMSHSR